MSSVSSGFDARGSGFAALRFMAALKAARDFGLDQRAVDAIALRFDPREPDLDEVAEALTAGLLRQNALALPDAV
jgi:hypothetical protein